MQTRSSARKRVRLDEGSGDVADVGDEDISSDDLPVPLPPVPKVTDTDLDSLQQSIMSLLSFEGMDGKCTDFFGTSSSSSGGGIGGGGTRMGNLKNVNKVQFFRCRSERDKRSLIASYTHN